MKKSLFSITLILIASLMCVPHAAAVVTGASLSANDTGTFNGTLYINAWGQSYNWSGTAKEGLCKLEKQEWNPSGPPCLVGIDLTITFDDTGNIGGVIDGEIAGKSVLRVHPGRQVGNWDNGAPRPFEGEGTFVISTNDIEFPGRRKEYQGTCQEWSPGTYRWSAVGEVIAQLAYDLRVETETRTDGSTDGAQIGTGAFIGTSVSSSTGRTQGVDWDFGQSPSITIDAASPGDPTAPVTGEWIVNTEFVTVKKCIRCGEDVETKWEHRPICGSEKPGIFAGCGDPYWTCPSMSELDDHKVRTCYIYNVVERNDFSGSKYEVVWCGETYRNCGHHNCLVNRRYFGGTRHSDADYSTLMTMLNTYGGSTDNNQEANQEDDTTTPDTTPAPTLHVCSVHPISDSGDHSSAVCSWCGMTYYPCLSLLGECSYGGQHATSNY
ncbi:hypothetical protein F4212_12940 [Candidatus Poribacteria bacterium]|nr:hypothetical protein [Candidatus Poribacteria bacterium]